MGELARRLGGLVEQAGQGFGRGAHTQEGQMRAKFRTRCRCSAVASAPSTAVDPGKAKRITSAMAARSTDGSTSAGPSKRPRSVRASGPGGRLALRSHGRAVVKAPRTTFLSAWRWAGVRTIAPDPGAANRWETSSAPGRADDLNGVGAQPVAQGHGCAAQAGSDRVAVASEGHAGLVIDYCADLNGGRERSDRQSHEWFGVGQLAHRGPRHGTIGGRFFDPGRAAQTGASRHRPEPVQADLGGLGVTPRPKSATTAPWRNAPPLPPTPCGSPAGAGTAIDAAVMLGHRREAGLHIGTSGNDNRRHAVHPPAPSGAPQPAQHRVHGLNQMCLVGGWGDHPPGAPRMRQRPQQRISDAAPGRLAPLEPVPLDLLAGRMTDLDRLPPRNTSARLAMRAQPGRSKLADETRIGTVIADLDHLVEKRRRPHVGVISEASSQIRHEPLQRIRPAAGEPPAGVGLPDSHGPSCGHGQDGGRSPRSTTPSSSKHVLPRLLPLTAWGLGLLQLEGVGTRQHQGGAPPEWWTIKALPAPGKWGISVIEPGESYVILNIQILHGTRRGFRQCANGLPERAPHVGTLEKSSVTKAPPRHIAAVPRLI